MSAWSKTSERRLATVHPKLQKVFDMAIRIMDITIVCGWRDREKQHDAYLNGNSDVDWPNSKHNCYKKTKLLDGKIKMEPESRAIDACPYPIDWNDYSRFYIMIGVIMACAFVKGIKLKFGAFFKRGNGKPFKDLGHVELDEDE